MSSIHSDSLMSPLVKKQNKNKGNLEARTKQQSNLPFMSVFCFITFFLLSPFCLRQKLTHDQESERRMQHKVKMIWEASVNSIQIFLNVTSDSPNKHELPYPH